MEEIFLEYASRGETVTKEELAQILKQKPDWVRRHSRPGAEIPRIPHIRQIRFDPIVLIKVFCAHSKPETPARSLTIEGHKTGAKPWRLA